MALSPTTSRGSSSLTLISDSGELAAPAASFDVAGIPATYTDLYCVLIARGTSAVAGQAVTLRINNDSGANYDRQQMGASAASPNASEAFGQTSINNLIVPAASVAAGVFGVTEATFFSYASTSFNKQVRYSLDEKEGVATGNILLAYATAYWRSSVAINRLTFAPAAGNFATGSRLRVFGVS